MNDANERSEFAEFALTNEGTPWLRALMKDLKLRMYTYSIGRPADVSLPLGVKHALTTAGMEGSHEVHRRLKAGEPLYPHNDTSIFWRSCLKEVMDTLPGETTGNIPQRLKGTLLQNGPGLSQIGDDKFQHWFDGPAMVHRFGIADGKATYQCRFLQSNSYRKNKAAGRIVYSEFGTGAAPDPCNTIFHRVSTLFKPGDSFTDNAMISVYPFGDEFYCFTETPVIHRIDPTTLDTLERVDLSKNVSIMTQTSHPHITADGSVYNQTLRVEQLGPAYSIVKFPTSNQMNDANERSEFAEFALTNEGTPWLRALMKDLKLRMYTYSIGRPADVSLPLGIKHALTTAGMEGSHEVHRRLKAGEPLYPHNDTSIFWRSCLKEVVDTLPGETTGNIPQWLKGTLLQNGPGLSQIGDDKFQHWFDGPAMVHRFGIADGKATYQCRFLQSNSYRKNKAAGRIVYSEFGTGAAPDPCNTIFHRVSTLFKPGDSFTDNAMISVYPFGDEFYCFTETPVIHRIDPTTLDTLERVDLSKNVSIMTQTSHPHITADGSVYNQTLRVEQLGPAYSIVKFPTSKGKRGKEMFDAAEVVASVKARWALHPSYMHTFGLTDRFYIIVEQPLTVSIPAMVKNKLRGDKALSVCFKYFPEEQTLFHVVERSTGNLLKTFASESFFFFHIVNQFEKDDHLVIDICCYSDASMIDALYREALENMNKNPDYARLFRGRPLRFVLPLSPSEADNDANLVTLQGSSAAAWWKNGKVNVRPELLCNIGCEMPRINYSRHLGRSYRYFYAISSDVDLDNPGTLVKVDTEARTAETWRQPGVFPSEPVFVPSPHAQAEDDGVILSSLLWGEGVENQVGLLVLDAATMQELGRTVFKTPSAVPKCLHGWFANDV